MNEIITNKQLEKNQRLSWNKHHDDVNGVCLSLFPMFDVEDGGLFGVANVNIKRITGEMWTNGDDNFRCKNWPVTSIDKLEPLGHMNSLNVQYNFFDQYPVTFPTNFVQRVWNAPVFIR